MLPYQTISLFLYFLRMDMCTMNYMGLDGLTRPLDKPSPRQRLLIGRSLRADGY